MGGTVDKLSNIGSTSDADRARTAASDAAKAAGLSAKEREKELVKLVGMAQGGVNQSNITAQRLEQIASDPRALRSFESAIGHQERSLAKQQELFNSIDPAIMEASKQALAVLQGGESAQSTGLAKRRQRDRQKLIDRLREQLGPGAETSTAGMQALNQFDAETENLQQGSMSQLFQMAGAGASNRSALNQGVGLLGNLSSGMQDILGSQAGMFGNAGTLRQGALANLLNAQSQRAGGAGSQFVQSQLSAQGRLANANQAMAGHQQMAGIAMGALAGPALGAAGSALGGAVSSGIGSMFGGGAASSGVGLAEGMGNSTTFTETVNPNYGNMA